MLVVILKLYCSLFFLLNLDFDLILAGLLCSDHWPITIKFKTFKRTSKLPTYYHCFLWLSFLVPDWLFLRNTITCHNYFWCSWFLRFIACEYSCFTLLLAAVFAVCKIHSNTSYKMFCIISFL